MSTPFEHQNNCNLVIDGLNALIVAELDEAMFALAKEARYLIIIIINFDFGDLTRSNLSGSRRWKSNVWKIHKCLAMFP